MGSDARDYGKGALDASGQGVCVIGAFIVPRVLK